MSVESTTETPVSQSTKSQTCAYFGLPFSKTEFLEETQTKQVQIPLKISSRIHVTDGHLYFLCYKCRQMSQNLQGSL